VPKVPKALGVPKVLEVPKVVGEEEVSVFFKMLN